MLVAIDLGGTNTDVVVATPDGTVIDTVLLPWYPVEGATTLLHLLAGTGLALDDVTAMAVTGGQHRMLPEALPRATRPPVPVLHVEELTAIGMGGMAVAGSAVRRSLILSMGTGTAMIVAGPEGFHHLGGSAVGGGTILGLARLTLGTMDPVVIGELAARGNPAAVDLTVGDIVGGSVGMIPAHMTAAHFGKVARADDPAAIARADVAAGLMELVGQVLARLGLMAARANDCDAVVLIGRLVEWPGVVRAFRGLARAFGGEIVVPADPGTVVARGALQALRYAQQQAAHGPR